MTIKRYVSLVIPMEQTQMYVVLRAGEKAKCSAGYERARRSRHSAETETGVIIRNNGRSSSCCREYRSYASS